MYSYVNKQLYAIDIERVRVCGELGIFCAQIAPMIDLF